jgi:hypothetical protein
MTTTEWSWADLTDDQLSKVATAEQSLGADYLLVYQPNPQDAGGAVRPHGLRPASLTESQLECLHGLETQLQAIVVAYTS